MKFLSADEGSVCRGIFFILHGWIRLLKRSDPIAELRATMQFGSWPLIYSGPTYDVGAEAVADAVLLRVGESNL